jgi:ATP-dependent Clp protease protease subunit
MIHQPLIRGGLSGQASDIIIEADEMVKTKDKLLAIMHKHTGQPEAKLRQDMERNFYMSAEEAKAYGIIDHVLPERKP